jgi:hypothetical protein
MIYHFPLPFLLSGRDNYTTPFRTPRLDSNTSDLLNEVTILSWNKFGYTDDDPETNREDKRLHFQKQGEID